MSCRYAPEHVAGQIVLRKGQQIVNSLLRVNFERAPGEFHLALRQNVIETCPQARPGIIAITERLAKAVNHRAFQCGGGIGGGDWRFRLSSPRSVLPSPGSLSSLR